jgi:3-oxoadipate enol-lactonase
MKFADVHGITLHYEHEGTANGLPLVFINALGTDLRIWDAVVPHLRERFQVVRFDKRGHGLSDTPPAPYSAHDLAGDVNGLLNYLGIESAVLVGVSVGGITALQTALDYPTRVKALVLCDTAARIGSVEYWDDRINTLREKGMPQLANTILGRWFTPEFVEQHLTTYKGFYNLLTQMPLEGYIGTCAALRDTDLRPRIGEINVPTLVLCGALDAATTPELVRGLADSLPKARFQLIEQAAHTPSIEQPEALVAAILGFMKELGYDG